MITFAYNNPMIINQLKERGNYIKNEQWDQLQKLNQKMTTQFRVNENSQQLIDSVQRPVTCFITFEYEEGYNRALDYKESIELENLKHYKTLLGSEITIKPSYEPSDIIFENQAFH